MKNSLNELAPLILYIMLASVASVSASENLPKVKTILKTSGLNIDYRLLNRGEIISTSREDLEITDTSIALTIVLYVKAPYKDVIKTFRAGENQLSDYKDAILVKIDDTKNIQPFFNDIKFTSREMKEVDELYDYDGGKTFNLSKDEIKKLEYVMSGSKNHQDKASLFFRNILENRLQRYLDGGINNISSYENSSRASTVKKSIKSSNLNMNVFKKYFPKMYGDYLNYPKVSSKGYVQNFYLIKDKIEDRPAFILKHQLVEEKDNLLVIAERQFYISNGLDAIQTQILCMPYKEGTFVALSSQSFTPKVSGFSRPIAVKVGRHMMEKQIMPVFKSLQRKFN